MFYCVPAWYNSDRFLGDVTDVFYHGQMRLEFDDTIHQFNTLFSNDELCQLIILNYSPQLRHFLYRQKIGDAQYYSIFDHIQNIQRKDEKSFNIDSLIWPEGAEFIYTPFLIIVTVNQKKFAHIEFAPEGNIYFIDYFKNNMRHKRYLIDDRGFISSVITFEQYQPQYQEYLNEAGVWQIREYLLPDKHDVYVNEKVAQRFNKLHYHSITELVEEFVNNYCQQIKSDDIVIISSSPQHNDMLLNLCQHSQCILSFFGDRYNLLEQTDWIKDCNRANLILVDAIHTKQKIVNLLSANQQHKVSYTTPYDARFTLGKSRSIKELIIAYLDTNVDDTLNMMALFEKIYQENQFIRLKILLTHHQNAELLKDNATKINERLQKAEDLDEIFEDIEEVVTATHTVEELISIVEIYNEIDIIKVVETARLIIDLSSSPNVFLQIAGISAGVPQINRVETSYVSHLENGYVADNNIALEQGILYYFTGLSNWNKSLVHSVRLIQENSGEALIKKWKELLNKYGKAY